MFASADDAFDIISAANLLNNDFDANGDVLTITGVTMHEGGFAGVKFAGVKLDDNGDVMIKLHTKFASLAETQTYDIHFTYTISDGQGGTATAEVTVTVIGTQFGKDFYWGDDDNNTVSGGEDDDTLFGNGGEDTLSGGDDDDKVHGGDGNDDLSGDDGDDFMTGGRGSDDIDGGKGNDTTSYREAEGWVWVDLRDGWAKEHHGERVGDGRGNEVLSKDIYNSIERSTGSKFSDIFYGDDNDNEFWGLEGNDIFKPLKGYDKMDGGGGTDTMSYESADGWVKVDLRKGTVEEHYKNRSGDGSEDEVISRDSSKNIENATGSVFDDILIGSEGDNELKGLDGDDIFKPLGGNNKVYGGLGTDMLDYSSAEGWVWVDLEKQWAQKYNDDRTGDGSGDEFINKDISKSVENAIGTDFKDILAGNNKDNKLEGRGGDDTFKGTRGDDILDGDGGTDTVDYSSEKVGGWVWVDLSEGWARKYIGERIGDGTGKDNKIHSTDTLISIETINGTGYNDILYGDENGNTINGLDGDDIIKGRDGDDYLIGGDGDDDMYGGKGFNIMIAGKGFNRMLGDNDRDEGKNTVDFSLVEIGVLLDLDETVIYESGYVHDDSRPGGPPPPPPDGDYDDSPGKHHIAPYEGRLFNIDDLIGSEYNDVLYADDFDNTIWGNDGEDYIEGRGGNDVLYGGKDKDEIYGNGGEDTIRGGDHDDTIYGGDDSDTISGDNGKDTISGNAHNDVIRGGNGNDKISGGLGNDEIHGDAGNDILYGDDKRSSQATDGGVDTFVLSTGEDTIKDFYASEGDSLKISRSIFGSGHASPTIRADDNGNFIKLYFDTNGDGDLDGITTLRNYDGGFEEPRYGESYDNLDDLNAELERLLKAQNFTNYDAITFI